MPMNPRLLRPLASGFNPRQIAGLGAWFDASDLSTLSQTSDGATPVTADNDPVGYLKCKITGTPLTQAVDANRPLWKAASSIGSKPGLEFDGNNDYLFATSGGLMDVARNVSGATAFYVLRSDSLNTRAYWQISIGGSTSVFAARMASAYISGTGFRPGGRRLDSDAFASAITLSYSAGQPYIARQTHKYLDAELQVHLNGASAATNNSWLTAGSTSDTASAYVMLGSSFTDDSLTLLASSFDGIFCEWLVYRRALTAAESSRVERYLSNKYGIALA